MNMLKGDTAQAQQPGRASKGKSGCLPLGAPFYVVCRSGMRSTSRDVYTYHFLQDLGIEIAFLLDCSIWVEYIL